MLKAIILVLTNLFLAAIRIHDRGVFQMTHQAGLHGIDIDPAQLVTLGQLLFGQLPGLLNGSQLVDSGDHSIHIHNSLPHT